MAILASLGLLLLTETGVPIPVPGDLLMLIVGERASAGEPHVAIAALLLEVVTVAGTITLFIAARGPAKSMIDRFGPRVGLTPERLHRFTHAIDRPAALALGRMTPGARTITVVAAGGAATPWRRTLPPLLLGSTLFVQAHLALGYALGPVARDALERARGPVLAAMGVLVVAGVLFWVVRRGRGAGLEAFSEAACPACLAVGALTGLGSRRLPDPSDEPVADEKGMTFNKGDGR
jgi:membrane protein DedA with SNARE-associated domain